MLPRAVAETSGGESAGAWELTEGLLQRSSKWGGEGNWRH